MCSTMCGRVFRPNAHQDVFPSRVIVLSQLTSQKYSVLCTDRLHGSDIPMLFPFRVPQAAWKDLLSIPQVITGEPCLQGYTRLSFRKRQDDIESSRYATEGICALLWPTSWLNLSGSVSKNHRKWADTAPSKALVKKKTTTQKSPSTTPSAFVSASPCHTVHR